MTTFTELEIIKIAKNQTPVGFTVSFMHESEIEDFIWGFLFDHGLQYKMPISYLDVNGNKKSAIIYEDK